METKIENGKLIITLPLMTPVPSSTGKTLLVATTHGAAKTSVKVNDKMVVVNVNAHIKAA